MGLIESAVTQWHRFVQRSADADTPASGYWNKYFKSGGLYIKNAAAGVFSLGGADATELTIASGAVTRTQLYHKIDTEADASTDDLDTISGGVAGQELIIRAENTGRDVVVRHNGGGTGNIRTFNGQGITLDETYKTVRLIFDGTNWITQSGGAGTNPNDLDPWGDPPDSTLKFLAQEASGDLWYLTGSEMRQWLNYPVTADVSLDLDSMRQFILNSATDRTLTINSATAGKGFRAYAVQVSGGTGHKVLLPANTYFGSTGTNRAAIFNAVDDYLDVSAYDAGGGVIRFLIYGSNGVTYAAS